LSCVPFSTGSGWSVLVTCSIGCSGVLTVVLVSVVVLNGMVWLLKVMLTTLVSVVPFCTVGLTSTLMLICSMLFGVRLVKNQVLFSMVGGGVLVMNVVFSGNSSVTVMLVAFWFPMFCSVMV